MAADPETIPFALDALYILGAARNGTGLSRAKARELTGAILQELRLHIHALYGSTPLGKGQATALCTALGLDQEITKLPTQLWEKWESGER